MANRMCMMKAELGRGNASRRLASWRLLARPSEDSNARVRRATQAPKSQDRGPGSARFGSLGDRWGSLGVCLGSGGGRMEKGCGEAAWGAVASCPSWLAGRGGIWKRGRSYGRVRLRQGSAGGLARHEFIAQELRGGQKQATTCMGSGPKACFPLRVYLRKLGRI